MPLKAKNIELPACKMQILPVIATLNAPHQYIFMIIESQYIHTINSGEPHRHVEHVLCAQHYCQDLIILQVLSGTVHTRAILQSSFFPFMVLLVTSSLARLFADCFS